MKYAMQVAVTKNVYVVIDASNANEAREKVEDLVFSGEDPFQRDFEEALDWYTHDDDYVISDMELSEEQIDWYVGNPEAMDFLEYGNYR
jgi:hypothetical protein